MYGKSIKECYYVDKDACISMGTNQQSQNDDCIPMEGSTVAFPILADCFYKDMEVMFIKNS